FCLLLQDPRPRRRGVGTGRFEVCPAGQRPRDRLTTIGGRYRRAEIATERERRVWRHAGERLELQRRHLDAAGEQLLARVQPIDLHQREVLLQRGGRALFDALLNDPERLAVDLQQAVGDTKIALRRQHLPRLHAHLAPQPALARGIRRTSRWPRRPRWRRRARYVVSWRATARARRTSSSPCQLDRPTSPSPAECRYPRTRSCRDNGRGPCPR